MTHPTFHLIFHTHWDREWYLPRAGFVTRLVPALGQVLDLLESEPDARFVLDGQTVILHDVLSIMPEWTERIGRAVARGALEIGPWYILADEIVPSGESMIRNLLLGSYDSRRFGRRMDVMYSPDAFGHPAILPMIAAEFGIEAAVMWRGLQSNDHRDHDHYRWRSRNGSELVVHHLPRAGYEFGVDLAQDPAELEQRWSTIRRELTGRATTSHIAVFVGADHHGPAPDPIGLRDALGGIERETTVRISTLAGYMANAAGESETMQERVGEFRWSYGHTWTLQGTHATRARMKRRFGSMERLLLRVVEPTMALAAWQGSDQVAGSQLRDLTRTVTECQFHDTICGCCSDSVAAEQDVRLTSAAAVSRELVANAFHQLSGHDADRARDDMHLTAPLLALWNPEPVKRAGICVATATFFRSDVIVGPPGDRVPAAANGYQPFALVSSDNVELPVQILSVTRGTERTDAPRHYPDQDLVDRVQFAFDVSGLPPLGFSSFGIRAADLLSPQSDLHVTSTEMANRFLRVRIASDGTVSVHDLRTGQMHRNICAIEDESDEGDTYTPRPMGDATDYTTAFGQPTVLAAGPLVGALLLPVTITRGRTAMVRGRIALILHADDATLRLRFELDNQAVNHRVRWVIPANGGDSVLVGAPLGAETRTFSSRPAGDFTAETPPTTDPVHRFVIANQTPSAVTVLGPGFFEYDASERSRIAITLFRGTGELSRNDSTERIGHAGWPMETPTAQELGTHLVDFALAFDGRWHSEATAEMLWANVFASPLPIFTRNFAGDAARLAAVGLELVGTGLVFSAMKPADNGNGIIVRCRNVTADEIDGTWRTAQPIRAAFQCRADETNIATLRVFDSAVIRFAVAPWSIHTIRILSERAS